MTQYCKQSNDIPTVGRRLVVPNLKTTIETLNQALCPDEVLVGCYDNGLWKVCPILTLQKDLDHFFQQYAEGQYIRMDYYAVRKQDM